MIRGETVINMMMVGAHCNNREHAILKIGHILKLTPDQVERLVEKNAFTAPDLEKLCDICGYVVALVPKGAFSSVPLV